MKLSTLLEIIGSGSILLLVGVAMLALGISYGFSEATQLPLWACLCGMGLFLGIVGIAFLDRGSEEAEQQVKTMPLMGRALSNPIVLATASILGGIILQRLFRRGRGVEQARMVVVKAPQSTPVEQPQKPASSSFSLSGYLGEQLRSLGAIAGGIALSTAVKSLGVPSMEKLVQDLTGEGEKKDEPFRSTDSAQSSGDDRMGWNDSAATNVPSMAPSSRPSLNHYNRPAPFDAAS